MGLITRATPPANGATSDVSHVNTDMDTVFNEVNGNLEDVNCKASTLTDRVMEASIKFKNWYYENFGGTGTNTIGFVFTGLDPSTSSSLTHTIPAGTAYVISSTGGGRIVTVDTAHTYTASKDTYVFLTIDGGFKFRETSVGGAAPTAPTNSLLVFVTTTDATTITAVATKNRSSVISASRWAKGYITSLRIVHDATTPANKIVIRSGLKCRDLDDTVNIEVTSAITGDITASGKNGLDTGTVANDTTYHIWIIADSGGVNSPAMVFSLSSTAPTMPSGYDKKRRLRQIRRVTADFRRAETIDSWSYLNNEEVALSGGTAASATNVNIASALGLTAGADLLIAAELEIRNDAGGDANFEVWNGNATDTANGSGHNILVEGQGGPATILELDSSGQMKYRKISGVGNANIDVWGWRENLGNV